MTKRNLTNQEQKYNDGQKSLLAKASKELIATSPSLFTNRVGVQNLITRYPTSAFANNSSLSPLPYASELSRNVHPASID